MNKKWQLPPAYESDRYKSFMIAEAIIEDYAEGRFERPEVLVKPLENYFCADDDAEKALWRFTIQLGGSNEDSEISDDPKLQAALVIGIVRAWASSETENRYMSFKALVRHSWWLENLWTKVALIVAQQNNDFKQALLSLAHDHFTAAEKKLLEEYEVDTGRTITLDDIWHGHQREMRTDESTWPWVELLTNLDPDKLFGWMNATKSLLLINRILDSPEFYHNYDLWENFTVSAPPTFESDGTWSGALLLPSLLRHGSQHIIHLADSHGYSPSVLDAHVKLMLTCFVNTIACRPDFLGLFKRWGTWLTNQHLKFPDNSSNEKRLVNSQDIFWAITQKIPLPYSPTISQQAEASWEPWIYQSMLALLHSNYPEKFPAPEISTFIEEWSLTPSEWNSSRGKSLRDHASEYHATRPDNYACRVLGYSVALSDDFTRHWLHMWNSSGTLREILEFRPTHKISKEWQPSDASGLMRTLVDVGLGILNCTTSPQETLNPEQLKQSAYLYQALWEATTEMLSIDFYGYDFWPLMQQNLAIRRLRWAVEAKNADADHYSRRLDKDAYPTAPKTLELVSSSPSSLIILLPLLVQNQIPKQTLKELINQTDIDLNSLASSAARFQSGPERKFNIHTHHVNLIKELA